MSHLALVSSVTSLLVAGLATVLVLFALRARERTGNNNLAWVAAAFAIFAVKNLFSAYNVWTHQIPHDAIELILSLFDLAILALLVAPLARRRGRR